MGDTSLTAYEIVGHRRVQGWVMPEVFKILHGLDKAQRKNGIGGSCAEIGVHHGRLFIAMHLLRDPGTRSVAIDVFGEQHLNQDTSGRGNRDVFQANLRRWADEDVEIIAADSTTINGRTISAISAIRMFSVDGGHTANVVAHDMRTAEEALTPGGVVIADDVFNEQWPGVVEGTLQYLQTGGLVPFAVGFNKVFLTHPDTALAYRTVAENVANARLWVHKDSEMAGFPVVVMWRPTPNVRLRKLLKRVVRSERSTVG